MFYIDIFCFGGRRNIMQWLEDGLKNIWLPYTQMKHRPAPLVPVVGARDCRLILANGDTLIDGISSWWSVVHGYSPPHIVQSMVAQVEKLSHVMFAGCAHEQAYTLATRLVQYLPKGLERVFFSDSGSTAVEVALKMAVQYYYNLGKSKKCKFVSFQNSYHGDTAGCMSVSSSQIHGATFKQYLTQQYNVPISEDLVEFKKVLELHHNDIAGVIIEPIMQAAGGMKFHSAETLRKIYEITKQYDVLFIADEIASGFYRLGKKFACNFADITPDIMTLGKALTGGMCSLGATISTGQVFSAFASDSLEYAFMHGPTFMANPIACAAANASLDIFVRENYEQKVLQIESQLQEELIHCQKLDKVREVRVKGAMAALEVKADWSKMFQLRQESVNLGVWLRPFADVIYLMPPLIIGEDELHKLTSAVIKLVKLL